MYLKNGLKSLADILGGKEMFCTIALRKRDFLSPLTKTLFYAGLFMALSACSLDANLQSLSERVDLEQMDRKEPDFIHGEVVTTSAGHQITGVFGEISETKKSFNNSQWEFVGVFYE